MPRRLSIATLPGRNAPGTGTQSPALSPARAWDRRAGESPFTARPPVRQRIRAHDLVACDGAERERGAAVMHRSRNAWAVPRLSRQIRDARREAQCDTGRCRTCASTRRVPAGGSRSAERLRFRLQPSPRDPPRRHTLSRCAMSVTNPSRQRGSDRAGIITYV